MPDISPSEKADFCGEQESLSSEDTERLEILSHGSHFEQFFELRQVTRAVAGDVRDVLEANAANFRIIQARFDRHDLAGAQKVS